MVRPWPADGSGAQPNRPGATLELEHASLDELVAAFIDLRVSETTVLLAALGELVLDDDVLRARCRREVDARSDDLPGWLDGLAQTSVHRVVRMTHILGDGDELLLGVRFADGQEMTCAVYIDHLMMSEVNDAFLSRIPSTRYSRSGRPVTRILTPASSRPVWPTPGPGCRMRWTSRWR